MWRNRLEQARAALDQTQPADYLWERTLEKAAESDGDQQLIGAKRRPRVLAAAAVLVLGTIGVVVAVAGENDRRVQTSPSEVDSAGDPVRGTEVETVGLDPPCGHLAVVENRQNYRRIDPAESPPTVPFGFQAPDAVFRDETVLLEVHSPGMVVRDLVGEEVEDISLNGDRAQVWISEHFVQVRSFPDPADQCAGFTVTASQGSLPRSEDELLALRRKAALELAQSIVVSAERLPSDDGSQPSRAGKAFALWPETDRSLLPAEEPEWSSSIESTAVAFATNVLEWDDATTTTSPVQADAGSHQLTVASPSRNSSVIVRASPVAPGRWRVTSVDSRPGDDTSASVQIIGNFGSASAGPPPDGTTTTSVRFQYGDSVSEGSASDQVELDRSPEVAGSVIVLYRNANGEVIGAWGTPLPPGDFAAG